VLRGGNHAAIAAWRREQALKRTLARRPDLLASAPLSPQDSAALLTLGATPDDLRAWGAPPAPPPKKVKRRKKPDDTPSGT